MLTKVKHTEEDNARNIEYEKNEHTENSLRHYGTLGGKLRKIEFFPLAFFSFYAVQQVVEVSNWASKREMFLNNLLDLTLST